MGNTIVLSELSNSVGIAILINLRLNKTHTNENHGKTPQNLFALIIGSQLGKKKERMNTMQTT